VWCSTNSSRRGSFESQTTPTRCGSGRVDRSQSAGTVQKGHVLVIAKDLFAIRPMDNMALDSERATLGISMAWDKSNRKGAVEQGKARKLQ
jgi:hypothetical protein